jgi:hypothetical protein
MFSWGGQRLRRELEEEMAFELEQPQTEFRSAGMAPDEAGQAARRQFGDDVRLRYEGCETVAFWTCCRISFRASSIAKGILRFACTAILVLVLGIGAGVAIFALF